MRDMAERERSRTTKLTTAQAEQIRGSAQSGPELAALFGVSRSTVNKIRRGESWKHLTPPAELDVSANEPIFSFATPPVPTR